MQLYPLVISVPIQKLNLDCVLYSLAKLVMRRHHQARKIHSVRNHTCLRLHSLEDVHDERKHDQKRYEEAILNIDDFASIYLLEIIS